MINSIKIIRLFLSVFFTLAGFELVFTAPTLNAKSFEVTSVAPAIAIASARGGIEVTYQLPCGAEFVGIAFSKAGSVNHSFNTISTKVSKHSSKNMVTLQVGAAYKASKYRCMKMPETQIKYLADINFSNKIRFTPFFPSLRKTPLRRAELESLSILNNNLLSKNIKTGKMVKNLAKANYIGLNYLKGCSALLDPVYVVQSFNKDTLHVGMLEYRKARLAKTKCKNKHQIHQLPFTVSTKIKKLDQIDSLDSLERPKFKIKALDSISHNHSQKQVTVNYKRKCNEAPVGVYFGRKVEGKTPVAMMVAAYSDERLCQNPNKHEVVSQYSLKNIQTINPIKTLKKDINFRENILVHTPKFISKSKQNTLKSSSTTACNKVIGSVLANRKKQIFMGDVMLSSTALSCSRSIATRTMTTALRTSSRKHKVSPMVLIGSPNS